MRLTERNIPGPTFKAPGRKTVPGSWPKDTKHYAPSGGAPKDNGTFQRISPLDPKDSPGFPDLK